MKDVIVDSLFQKFNIKEVALKRPAVSVTCADIEATQKQLDETAKLLTSRIETTTQLFAQALGPKEGIEESVASQVPGKSKKKRRSSI